MRPLAGEDGDRRTTAALLATLALLWAARAAAAWVPGSLLWSLDALRFLPWPAWVLWALAAASIVPPLARRLLPPIDRVGSWVALHPGAAGLVGAAAAALLVLALPDRLHFTDDFLLREHALGAAVAHGEVLFPQAMPLDMAVHERLARQVMAWLPVGPNGAGRAIGAIEAAALALVAARLPRALGIDGAVAFSAWGIAFWSGVLGLMTGYNKALSELGLVTLCAGIASLSLVRTGRGLWPLALSVAAGLLLHRLALLLLPAAAIAISLGLRRHGGASPLRRPAVVGALLVPLVAIAVVVPKLVSLGGFDVANFTPALRGEQGGPLAAALAGTRAIDLANLLLAVAPLVPLVPLLVVLPPRRLHASEAWTLAALVVPLVAFLPFFHPSYGLFRNWDDAVPTGVALSLAVAVLVADRVARDRAWLAVPALLSAAVPIVFQLWIAAVPSTGLARVERFLAGPPERGVIDRASGWDFLGFRYTDFGRLDDGVAAFERAAALAPSPRTLRAWAAVEMLRGDLDGARAILRRLLESKPDDLAGWTELMGLAMQADDVDEARSAAARLLELDPGNEIALRVLARLPAGGR